MQAINDLMGGGSILAIVAMVAIVLGTIAVNAMNDYTGSLSLQAAGVRVKRVYSAVVVAILGFLFTLYLNSGDFFSKFENFLLFISYWIAPWGAVVLVDWWLRKRTADATSLVDFAKLPRGLLGLGALIIGFIASAPFQTSVLGGDIATATGLPINTVAAGSLHYADFAYLIGFVVSALVYWIGARVSQGRQTSA